MPAADFPTNWDGNWDQTLDHLSAIDRHAVDANGLKDVTWPASPVGAAPANYGRVRGSGHGVVCTGLNPGERRFGRVACFTAAPTEDGARGQSVIDAGCVLGRSSPEISRRMPAVPGLVPGARRTVCA